MNNTSVVYYSINNSNNNHNNNNIPKLPIVILVKIINYLTSFFDGPNFRNEIFTIVFNNLIKDLSMVSKEWYNMVSRSLKLPNFYLLDENSLEDNKTIQRMIKADSTFIKIGIATKFNMDSNRRFIEKYFKSISTVCLQANQYSYFQNVYSPWSFTNINKLELILSNCKSWMSFFDNLFPTEIVNRVKENIDQKELLEFLLKSIEEDKKMPSDLIEQVIEYKENDYYNNFDNSDQFIDWTKNVERLIITNIQDDYSDDLDLSTLNGYIELGGFESLYSLKLVSNNKTISHFSESLLIQNIADLCLSGIKLELDSFDKLLSLKKNKLRHLEILQCTTDKNKSFGLNLILAKYITNGTCKLETYHNETIFEHQDINSVIVFLSSTHNSPLYKIHIKTQLELSDSDINININSIPYQSSSAKFLSLSLPDPSFIKFIFSKVSFNLSSINLKFYKTHISNLTDSQINEYGYDGELIEIILQILENQINTLNTIRIQLNDNELEKIKKKTSYPSICNWKKLFKFVQERPNQIQEIDLKNIWISKSTIIEALESFNSNPKSLIRYFGLSGLSDIEASDFINNIDHLLINNCKLLTLSLSLLPLNSLLPKPSSFINRYKPSFFKGSPITFVDLLIEILEKSNTIEHLNINEYDERLYTVSEATKKRLENSINSNVSLVSIGVPNYFSHLVPSSKSIFPYFNPIIR